MYRLIHEFRAFLKFLPRFGARKISKLLAFLQRSIVPQTLYLHCRHFLYNLPLYSGCTYFLHGPPRLFRVLFVAMRIKQHLALNFSIIEKDKCAIKYAKKFISIQKCVGWQFGPHFHAEIVSHEFTLFAIMFDFIIDCGRIRSDWIHYCFRYN